jgi:hypothetical protein
MAAKSISDLRKELGAYLTKPMEVGAGNMSTQQNMSATTLSTGGLSGSFIIKDQGNISIYNSAGQRSVYIGF